jgi:hypothetical protein
MKPGTKIELHGNPAFGVAPEQATIARPPRRKPRPWDEPVPDGFHIVQFADGGQLYVHETRFRVVGNG